METVKIIRDRFDMDMVLVYVKLHRHFGIRKNEARWYLTSSMHADMAEALFGTEILDRAQYEGEAEILVGTHLNE